MTPRAFWDRDFVLWEENPEDPGLIRWVWSPFPHAPHGTNRWIRRSIVERGFGFTLVATC